MDELFLRADAYKDVKACACPEGQRALKGQAWKLARYNNIIDIKATIVNGKKIIQSEKEGLLEGLPTMEG